MRAVRRHLSRLGVTLAVLAAVMCADPGDPGLPGDTSTGDATTEAQGSGQPDASPTGDASVNAVGVRYHLAWEWGTAQPTEDGWMVVNDRGYEVQVTGGYLVTYSVQLAPCTDEDLNLGGGLGQLFGIGRAWAGHGGEEDPSAWLTGLAEPLAFPEPHSLEPVVIDSGTYCRVHYLVARAEMGTQQLPEDIDLMGTSLYVVGTAALDGEAPEPFTVWSTLPTGRLMAWTDPVSPIELDPEGVNVTLTRDLGRLFDGVEFATMTSESMEKTILLGLIERLRVRVE